MTEISENIYFKPQDFILFILVLVTSCIIGFYFAIASRKRSTVNEYLLGGNSLGVVPIAFSLTSSIISPLAMVAVPSENYRFGITLVLLSFLVPLCILFIYFAILPVYCNLKLISIYEYIEFRFSSRLRKICSALYTINILTHLPVAVFIPSIALAQGTGFDMQYVAIFVTIICAFYTAIGGIKTVVWTDAFQFAIMIVTTTSIAVMGTIKSGGIEKILADSKSGGRLDIDFSFDPTKTYTFWTVVLGYGVFWIQYIGANQACIQKCFTLPSKKHIKQSLILFGVCIGFLQLTTNYAGLILYSTFKDCDPFSVKQIKYHDELLPFYVLHLLSDIPGLSGLFIAGIFCATLSTLSAGMNALACTIYSDFIRIYLDDNFSEERKSFVLKLIVAVVGIIATLLVLVIGKFGTMMSATSSFGGLFAGPVFGVFLLGLFLKRANSKAAFCGIIGSFIILSWIFGGQQFYKFNKLTRNQAKSVSTEGCPQSLNYTTSIPETPKEKPFFLFEISFFYFTFLGTFLAILIGSVASLFSRNQQKVPEKYLSPLRTWKKQKVYSPVDIQAKQEEDVL